MDSRLVAPPAHRVRVRGSPFLVGISPGRSPLTHSFHGTNLSPNFDLGGNARPKDQALACWIFVWVVKGILEILKRGVSC